MQKDLSYVGPTRGAEQIMMFTNDVERLLSKNSPILKQHENPMAYSRKETAAIGQEALQPELDGKRRAIDAVSMGMTV